MKPSNDVTPEALMASRRDWAKGQLVNRAGRKGLGELLLAAGMIATALGIDRYADRPFPEWARLGLGTLGLLGVAIFVTGLWRLAGRLRFGVVQVELAERPLQRGGTTEARLVIPRRVHFAGPLAVRLSACEVVTTRNSDGDRKRTERVLWQDVRYVRSDRIRLEPEETFVPLRLEVPLEAPDSSLARRGERFLWRLEVTGRTSGPNLTTSFELPVLGVAPASARSSAPTSDDEPPPRSLLELAGFRLVDTAGGLRATQPLVPAPTMALGLALANLFLWGGVAMLLAAEAPLIFPLVFGLVGVLVFAAFVDSLLGRARLRVRHGELSVVKGPPVLGLRGSLDRQAFEGLRIASGDRVGHALFFHLEVPKGAGPLGGRRLVASLPDRATAEALVGELRAAFDRAA